MKFGEDGSSKNERDSIINEYIDVFLGGETFKSLKL